MNIDYDLKLLGPLARLAGQWKGSQGRNLGPDKLRELEDIDYSETLNLVPIKVVKNHEQTLYGLRYDTTAFRNGSPFHEELGYWLWEPKAQEVYRCFTVPRGVVVLAGGKVAPDAMAFSLEATIDHPAFGISSIPFLNQEFKTVRYTLDIQLLSETEFSYKEITYMQMPGKSTLFEHLDENVLSKV